VEREELMIPETLQEEKEKQSLQIDSIKKLKRKLCVKDNKLKSFKKETSKLIAELDWAYKEFRRAQEELIMKEKLSAAGGLASGIAHEIRNSINFIGMSVQHLHSKFPPGDERREFTAAIMDKIKRLNDVASDLIQFAQPHKPNFQKIEIHTIIERMLRLVKFKCSVQKVKVVKQYEQTIPEVMIDKELMEQVFLNLIDNALWAMSKGGKLIITTALAERKNYIEIEMTDTGCGVSKSDCSHVFDPFFTLKENGTGLGLPIVHRIIEEHKGSIRLKSQLKKGMTIRIRLPISQNIGKNDESFKNKQKKF
jgi:signal transduction histidine kinase